MLFISLPFVVRTVQPVLAEMEKDIEEAAWCLGASNWQTFWRVVLPPLFPAILTGVALGFSRAVGEYGSTVIVASNTPFQDFNRSGFNLSTTRTVQLCRGDRNRCRTLNYFSNLATCY